MVGYTEDSPSDCYNVVKKSNGRVVVSGDIKWSNPHWKTTQGPPKPDDVSTMSTNQRATTEKHVDFALPELSDSEDSNHAEHITKVLNNHKDYDTSDDSSSEQESMNPSLQSEESASILASDNCKRIQESLEAQRELQRLQCGAQESKDDDKRITRHPKDRRALKRLQ